MLTVETIGRIRREHFLKGKTIKEIARDLRVSRNTVRKVLRSGETSFEYEREVQPRPKLGRWTAEIDELLASNAAKAAREQLTLIRIFEELRGRGYDGGYDAVRRYARRWSKERGQATAAAYVPLSFAPGEAYQFDWSHEVVLLNGTTVIVKVAHVRFSNRPVGVKHFQAIHRCNVDVAHGLALLFGIGTRPFHHGIRGRGGTIC
jgi:transposase-like protein